MKIFVTGGTGFIGGALVEALLDDGHEVAVLSRRNPVDHSGPTGVRIIKGNPTEAGDWQQAVGDFDVLVNLVGEPISRRWNSKSKDRILDSRILSTHNLIRALAHFPGKKIRLVNASAVGYYGFHRDCELDENSTTGGDFLAVLAFQWERTAEEARRFGARVILCRFGIVLGSQGGFWARMHPLFRRRLGARLGKGTQWVSWIHLDDLVDSIRFILNHPEWEGPFNLTAPAPVRNQEMTRIMNQMLKRHSLIPFVPGFILKIRYGEFAETLLEGQKVIPRRLLDAGYQFHFPEFSTAVESLLKSD